MPEWAASYIDYKGLKKLIKAAAEAAKNGEPADLAGRGPFSRVTKHYCIASGYPSPLKDPNQGCDRILSCPGP